MKKIVHYFPEASNGYTSILLRGAERNGYTYGSKYREICFKGEEPKGVGFWCHHNTPHDMKINFCL